MNGLKMIRFIILCFGFVCFFSAAAAADTKERYMVVLKEDSDFIMPLSEDGLRPISSELNIYCADSGSLEMLYAQGVVEEAVKDVPLTVYDDYDNNYSPNDSFFSDQWYYPMLNISELKQKGEGAKGVRIAVIDTGANINHPDLAGANIAAGYNYLDENEDIEDDFGHGTKVLGLMAAQSENAQGISGVSDNAEYVVLKVMNSKTSSSVAMAEAILDAAEKYECDIINVSLGTYTYLGKGFQTIIDSVYEKGAIIFSAAGNDGRSSQNGTQLSYPAANEHVIGVGSINKNFEKAAHSQYNESVILTSPGEAMTVLSGTDGYSTGSGTSFASPTAAGVFALLKEKFPELNYDIAVETIKAGSLDIDELGYDVRTGYGCIDAMGFYNYLLSGGGSFVSPYNTLEDGVYRIKVYSKEAENAAAVFAVYDDERPIDISYHILSFEDDISCFEREYQKNAENKVRLFLVDSFDSLRLLSER